MEESIKRDEYLSSVNYFYNNNENLSKEPNYSNKLSANSKA